ncbi:hypothetical protein ACUOA8_53565, partial [Escherichia sp. SS-MK2]
RRQSGDGIRRFADCGRTKGAGNHITLLRSRGGGFTVRFPDAARLQIAAEADTGKRLYGNASDLVTMIKTLSGISLGSDLQPRGVWKTDSKTTTFI